MREILSVKTLVVLNLVLLVAGVSDGWILKYVLKKGDSQEDSSKEKIIEVYIDSDESKRAQHFFPIFIYLFVCVYSACHVIHHIKYLMTKPFICQGQSSEENNVDSGE